MILWFFCLFCFEGVALPWLPDFSKEMVIPMKYQQLTHSKNRQILKIKKKHNYKKKKKSVTASSLHMLLFKLFLKKFLIFFF